MRGDDSRLGHDAPLNRDGKPETWAGGATTVSHVYLNLEFSAGDRLVTAAHEAIEHVHLVIPLPVEEDYRSAAAAYNQLPDAARGSAARWGVFLSGEGLLPAIGAAQREAMRRSILEIKP